MASARIHANRSANNSATASNGSLSTSSSASKPLAATMKGKIASRAHSFKENILEAFGHGHHHHGGGAGSLNTSLDASFANGGSGSPASNGSASRSNIHLAKKTNSTDNLIGYSEPKHTADGLVRDVQLALRYFEDAVSKGTLELLPGCASIVLERVVAIQAFAFYDGGKGKASEAENEHDAKVREALSSLYASVSALVKWADAVIVAASGGGGGEGGGAADDLVDCSAADAVVEPVRKSVIVLVNRLNRRAARTSSATSNGSAAVGGASSTDGNLAKSKTSGLHNSLPDIAGESSSSHQQEDAPRLPKRRPHQHHHHHGHHHGHHHHHHHRRHSSKKHQQQEAPPLPPKRQQQQAVTLADPTVDWFSNPLFETSAVQASRSKPSGGGRRSTCYETSFIGEPRPAPMPAASSQNPKPQSSRALTLPTRTDEANFPFMDEATSPMEATTAREEVDRGVFREDNLPSPSSSREWESAAEAAKPPALPRKKSQYDNVYEGEAAAAAPPGVSGPARKAIGRHAFLQGSQSFDLGMTGVSGLPANNNNYRGRFQHQHQQPRHHPQLQHQMSGERRCSDDVVSAGHSAAAAGQQPPPLPPKKRDIINYMEMLGQSLLPSREDLMQSLAQTQTLLRNVWADNYHQFGEFVPSDNNAGFNHFPVPQDLFTRNVDLSRLAATDEDDVFHPVLRPLDVLAHQSHGAPPALPPKKNRPSLKGSAQRDKTKERIIPIVRESDGTVVSPSSPYARGSAGGGGHLTKRFSTESAGTNSPTNSSVYSENEQSVATAGRPSSQADPPPPPPLIPPHSASPTPPRTPTPQEQSSSAADTAAAPDADSALNSVDPPGSSLIYASNSEGLTELRAGDLDELVVLATQTSSRDFVYQDAFLLTYRTFVSTMELLGKLQHRFRRFNNKDDALQLRAARSSFSLMVRVVDSLIDCDLSSPSVNSNLSSFISELVERGDLLLARALRTKFIQKYEEHRTKLLPDLDFGRLAINQKPPSILQFKSSELAEQITLMDHAHFCKLEPGELLLWVKEQNEEKSPNLVKFTKHFNAMSFWCRTCILTEQDPREREKLAGKLIKVMKVLRKQNNFNSYLAFLSALDSASIRRLDWPRSVVETIGEYSAIIDFSGSFKAYREALAHATPPLIPYMGLVLQDLTFVHIGNSDSVKGGKVNFAKRWQQYNILDNVRRFKRASYPFVRREDIHHCFGDFEDHLPENKLWELSEKLKPRTTTSAAAATASSAASTGQLLSAAAGEQQGGGHHHT